MPFRHTAAGTLVTALVLLAAPAPPAAAAALPAGCTSGALPTGGVHLVCTQGVPAGTTLTGTDQADIIEVEGGVYSSTIDGGDGDDILRLTYFRVPGYDKASRLDGGSGDDTISVGKLAGPLRGGPGADEITVDGTPPVESRLPKPATVHGDEGDDVIRVGAIGIGDGARATYVHGGAGADLIEVPSAGQDGYATVSGDDDDDVIQGPGATHIVLGPYGTVDGGEGDNTCRTDDNAGGTVTRCRS
ncbi:hypothetical protein [Streptomyces albireticuli]|uniref:hypothetical protein n=1 Tax=Streptomyces albireticuli TaxID=1940 RepID=UPI003693C366